MVSGWIVYVVLDSFVYIRCTVQITFGQKLLCKISRLFIYSYLPAARPYLLLDHDSGMKITTL